MNNKLINKRNIADKDLKVIKSNNIIEARYRLSIGEQRLVLLLLSKIDNMDNDFQDYFIPVKDFINIFSLSRTTCYKEIKKSLIKLNKREIEIMQDNGNYELFHWFSYIKYYKKTEENSNIPPGTIQFRFDPAMKKYFFQLKEKFTQYKLNNVVRFKNAYSIRLYEFFIMEQWKHKNKSEFTVEFEREELRRVLVLDNQEYSLFSNLRRRIIEPAKKEISSHSDINIVNIHYNKFGKEIKSIAFTIRKKENQFSENSNENELKNKTEIPDDIRGLIAFGISEETALKWRKKYGKGRIERNLGYTKSEIQKGIVKNPLSFLSSAIEKDYGGSWHEEEEKKKLMKEKIIKEQEAEQIIQKQKNEEKNQKIQIFEKYIKSLTDIDIENLYKKHNIDLKLKDTVKQNNLRIELFKNGVLKLD